MTLHEVLERAAEMNPDDRRKLVQLCGAHDIAALPRTSTGGNPGPPYYCPVCYTVFSPASLRMWKPRKVAPSRRVGRRFILRERLGRLAEHAGEQPNPKGRCVMPSPLKQLTEDELVEKCPTDASGDRTWSQTPYVLEMQRRLLLAIGNFNEQSSRQSRRMIALTWVLAVLTVVIAILTAVMVFPGRT